MRAIATQIPDVRIVEYDRFDDPRGAFAETYDTLKFKALGIDTVFVMDAWSYGRQVGTLRGLHFQSPPRAQAKFLRVVRGHIFDVALDLRRSSPTYGRHAAIELRAGDCRAIYIPAGFAHGFCTLEPDTEIVYKTSDHYSPEHQGGVLWNDPALAIAWPISAAKVNLIERDTKWPRLADLGPVYA